MTPLYQQFIDEMINDGFNYLSQVGRYLIFSGQGSFWIYNLHNQTEVRVDTLEDIDLQFTERQHTELSRLYQVQLGRQLRHLSDDGCGYVDPDKENECVIRSAGVWHYLNSLGSLRPCESYEEAVMTMRSYRAHRLLRGFRDGGHERDEYYFCSDRYEPGY